MIGYLFDSSFIVSFNLIANHKKFHAKIKLNCFIVNEEFPYIKLQYIFENVNEIEPRNYNIDLQELIFVSTYKIQMIRQRVKILLHII